MLIFIIRANNINILQQIFLHMYIFLKGNNLRANTTSTWPPCPFPIFIFEVHKGFYFLKMIWQFLPMKWLLNSVVFNPCAFVLHLCYSSSCTFLKLKADLDCWGMYIFQPSGFGDFVYGLSFSHLNLVVLHMIVFVYHI